MLEQLINPETLKKTDHYKTQFQTAEPFEHVVIDDFFQAEFCQELLDQFPDFKAKDAVDENQTIGKKAVVQSVPRIGKAYKMLDEMVQSQAFLQWVETVTGIDHLLYDPHYIGGGTHNNMDGQELDPHVDFTHHPINSHHRRLNLIVYLNHQWQEAWGGNIEFHKNPRLLPTEDQIISVKPLFNRAVIFATHNHSWHGFPAIDLPQDKKHLTRKSFALYYYTEKRQNAVEPHSTIYVERHLPERFKAGLALSDEDVRELNSLLNRRDQHLARLYQSVTSQTVAISQLKSKLLMAQTMNINSDETENIQQKLALLSYDETRLLNRIQELENSTSWRLTAPLRAIKRWLNR